MNLKIAECRKAITNYVNGLDLPLEVVRMILKEVYTEAGERADEAIVAEFRERERVEQGKERKGEDE